MFCPPIYLNRSLDFCNKSRSNRPEVFLNRLWAKRLRWIEHCIDHEGFTDGGNKHANSYVSFSHAGPLLRIELTIFHYFYDQVFEHNDVKLIVYFMSLLMPFIMSTLTLLLMSPIMCQQKSIAEVKLSCIRKLSLQGTNSAPPVNHPTLRNRKFSPSNYTLT